MIRNFVTKPLFTLSIFAVILLLGLFSYMRLPLDFLPNISIPTLTIITPYPGASPEDIETTVSKVIEDSVATVANIDKITSDSIENMSIVTISFKWGSNLDAAAADVRDKLDLVSGKLPTDIQMPTIYKFDTSQIPVLVIGVSAKDSYRDLYHLCDKKIANSLKKIEGVGTISLSGGLQRQINVDIDRNRLEAYYLSLSQINMSLQAANLSMPAGSVKTTELSYGVRVPGEFTDVDQIGMTIVGSYNGNDVFLSDIAKVTDSFVEPDSITEVDGNPGIRLTVQKQSGANTVNIAKAIRKQIEMIKEELPPDVEFTYVTDTSESIERNIEELTRTLMYAFFFVVLAVLFFLRNIRGSLIISLAMPFSIISAFVYLYATGGSINIISLASIIISIGTVVDDAIVVLENIYRHKDKKHEMPNEAAIYGTGEVSGAVLASTTTNLVIFIPLLLVQGFVGIFFGQLSTVTIVIIAMSFVTAMTLTPMLASKILKSDSDEQYKSGMLSKFYQKSEEMFLGMEAAYRRTLEWALKNKRRVVTVSALAFFLSMPVFLFTGTEFFPDMDSGQATGNFAMPAGTRLEQTMAAMRKIAARVKKEVPELEYIMVTAGTDSMSMSMSKSGPNYGNIYLKVVPLSHRKRSMKEIQRQLTDIALSIPGVKSLDYAAGGANQMAGVLKPITVEIYGNDFDDIDNLAAELKDKIEKVPGTVDIGLSREKTNPEYRLVVDRAKASDLGLTMYDVGMAARGYIYGTKVSKYREGGDEYDIFVRLKEENRKGIRDIKNVFATNRIGKNIALGNIANVELQNSPQVIQRKNQQRYMMITGDYVGRPLGDIMSDINKIIARTGIPNDVSVKIAGSAEQMQDSFRSLLFALVLGIVLIYLVLVAQFESFFEPFIIMFAIPFAVVGVIWSLFLMGYPFGIMAFVGLILVTGIAVKNSIVLVDYTNILRGRGLSVNEAILEAGKTRLRPILMTSICTMLGLMPIIFGSGESSGFWKAMAVAVMGGLLVSMSITLIFVPTFYSILESRFRSSDACGTEGKLR